MVICGLRTRRRHTPTPPPHTCRWISALRPSRVRHHSALDPRSLSTMHTSEPRAIGLMESAVHRPDQMANITAAAIRGPQTSARYPGDAYGVHRGVAKWQRNGPISRPPRVRIPPPPQSAPNTGRWGLRQACTPEPNTRCRSPLAHLNVICPPLPRRSPTQTVRPHQPTLQSHELATGTTESKPGAAWMANFRQ